MSGMISQAHGLSPVKPKHVSVIMDGNGRWATARALPRSAGHKAGVEVLRELCRYCLDLEIPYLTVYAFSTENWRRPLEEISALMGLVVSFFDRYERSLEQEGIRIRLAGRVDEMPAEIAACLRAAEERTKGQERLNLVLCLNYGGRAEIADAVKKLWQDLNNGEILPSAIDELALQNRLYQPDIPEPDLLIRTGGELRLSNFLLWQSAYTELYFTDCLWPDFGRAEFEEALAAFAHRKRRFGAI